VGGEGVASIKEAIPLKQITVKKCGQDIYVEGYLTTHQTVDVSYQQGVTEH
jgi:hypothetical protein